MRKSFVTDRSRDLHPSLLPSSSKGFVSSSSPSPFVESSLIGSVLRAGLLAASIYFFTVGLLLKHAPSINTDIHFNAREVDVSAQNGELNTRPSPGPNTAAENQEIAIEVYAEPGCKGAMMKYLPSNDETYCERCADMCHRTFESSSAKTHNNVQSFRAIGPDKIGGVEWWVTAETQCSGSYFYPKPDFVRSRVTPKVGCIELGGDKANLFAFKNVPDVLPWERPNSFHIAYSAESSTYFGYQAYANYYAFQHSNQPEGTGYTRLLTSSEMDDLNLIPTFQAPRIRYSSRYAPINKPDVIDKWLRSPSAPKEDVIIIIDPDNWVLQPLTKYARKVTQGHAVAQSAFFYKSPLVKELFQLVCERNCDYTPDDAAVPYFVHREDLKRIAPLWRDLTIKLKDMSWKDPSLVKRFHDIQIDWCAEMYGYVFAAAELGIRHTIKSGLQLRDVDTPVPKEREASVPMIHMGRAWFPDGDKSAERWRHTEGRNFAYRGIQVWCKCNWTASHILPWPVPEGTDFASRVTLELLHNSMQEYGPLPKSKYRGGPTEGGYRRNYP